jgi:hypothetical protein
MMKTRKRDAMPQMIKAWLATNRHGKLTSDQWLNLVTAPLYALLPLSVPLVLLFIYTPLRYALRLGAYGGYLLILVGGGVVMMLILRARRYASLPLYQDVLYPDKHNRGVWGWLQRAMTLYTEKGDSVPFTRFVTSPPRLEADMPYLVYYLQDGGQRTWLSHAPLHHPDAKGWQPSEAFYERQKKRIKDPQTPTP